MATQVTLFPFADLSAPSPGRPSAVPKPALTTLRSTLSLTPGGRVRVQFVMPRAAPQGHENDGARRGNGAAEPHFHTKL